MTTGWYNTAMMKLTPYRRTVLAVFRSVPHRGFPHWWSEGWMRVEYFVTKSWE